MKKAIFLALSIIAVLSITISGIKNEYYLTGDDKIVCDAILVHALEFDNPEFIKVTGGSYNKDIDTIFISIATKNSNGILVGNCFRIYGENFERMDLLYNYNTGDRQENSICVIATDGNLNLQKINNCIRRKLRE